MCGQQLSGGSATSETTSAALAEGTVRECSRLLAQAEIPDGGAAALFAFEGPGQLTLVASVRAPSAKASTSDLEQAASTTSRTGRPASLDELVPYTASTARLAIPVRLDGELVAAVALSAHRLELDAWSARIEQLLLPLALLVDRGRTQAALEHRAEEIVALRQQLDAYAVDFRSTYLAEKARSSQLADALAELEQTYRATVRGLAIAVEAKDECTGGHIQRVSKYGMMLTRLVAPRHADDPQLEYGFLLHDVGKLTVPDLILRKPAALDEAEWALMRQHPQSGFSILEGIPFLEGAREIVYSHHERWDGKGYPRGLKGEEIPLGAQLFPICDAFDAMTSDRPYRNALPIAAALDELRAGSGSQFRPDAVEAFLCLPLDELEAMNPRPTRESVH